MVSLDQKTRLHKAIYNWQFDDQGQIQAPQQALPLELQKRKQYFTRFVKLQPFTLMTYIFPEQEQITDIKASFERKFQQPWLEVDEAVWQMKNSADSDQYEHAVLVAVIAHYVALRENTFVPQTTVQSRLWQSITAWQQAPQQAIMCPKSQLPMVIQQRIKALAQIAPTAMSPFEELMYIWPDPRQIDITKKFFEQRTHQTWPPVAPLISAWRQSELCIDYELAIMMAVVFGLQAKVIA